MTITRRYSLWINRYRIVKTKFFYNNGTSACKRYNYARRVSHSWIIIKVLSSSWWTWANPKHQLRGQPLYVGYLICTVGNASGGSTRFLTRSIWQFWIGAEVLSEQLPTHRVLRLVNSFANLFGTCISLDTWSRSERVKWLQLKNEGPNAVSLLLIFVLLGRPESHLKAFTFRLQTRCTVKSFLI